MGPGWSTITGCTATVSRIALSVEPSWPNSAEARSVAKRGRDSCTESCSSPSRPARSPLGPTHRIPDHDPPARKAARATSPDDADVPSPPMSPLPLGFARRTPAGSHLARSATHAVSLEPRPGFPWLHTVLRRTCCAPISIRPAVIDPACVIAATAFRHTGYHFDVGSCTVVSGRDPVVPIVAGIPAVKPVL